MFPVIWEKTVVNYSFTTLRGVLRFGIKFIYDNKEEKVIRDLDWCDSQSSAVGGTIFLADIGKINFTWDNSVQSWISEKRLNYRIQLMYKKISSFDDTRSQDSLKFLEEIRRHKYDLLIKLGTTQGNLRELDVMEKKLQGLHKILRTYKKESRRLILRVEESLDEAKFKQDRLSGICLRLVEAKILRKIFGYLEPSFSQNHEDLGIVCKYWNYVIKQERLSKKIGCVVPFKSPTIVKLDSPSVRKMLGFNSLEKRIAKHFENDYVLDETEGVIDGADIREAEVDLILECERKKKKGRENLAADEFFFMQQASILRGNKGPLGRNAVFGRERCNITQTPEFKYHHGTKEWLQGIRSLNGFATELSESSKNVNRIHSTFENSASDRNNDFVKFDRKKSLSTRKFGKQRDNCEGNDGKCSNDVGIVNRESSTSESTRTLKHSCVASDEVILPEERNKGTNVITHKEDEYFDDVKGLEAENGVLNCVESSGLFRHNRKIDSPDYAGNTSPKQELVCHQIDHEVDLVRNSTVKV